MNEHSQTAGNDLLNFNFLAAEATADKKPAPKRKRTSTTPPVPFSPAAEAKKTTASSSTASSSTAPAAVSGTTAGVFTTEEALAKSKSTASSSTAPAAVGVTASALPKSKATASSSTAPVVVGGTVAATAATTASKPKSKKAKPLLFGTNDAPANDAPANTSFDAEEMKAMLGRVTVDQLKELCIAFSVRTVGLKKKSDFITRMIAEGGDRIDATRVKALLPQPQNEKVTKKRPAPGPVVSHVLPPVPAGTPADSLEGKKGKPVATHPAAKRVKTARGVAVFRSRIAVLRKRCKNCESCAECGEAEISGVVRAFPCKECAACALTHQSEAFETICDARRGPHPVRAEIDVRFDERIGKFVHSDTNFVMGEDMTRVDGVLVSSGKIVDLTPDEVLICRSLGLRCSVGRNLDILTENAFSFTGGGDEDGDEDDEDGGDEDDEHANDVNAEVQGTAAVDIELDLDENEEDDVEEEEEGDGEDDAMEFDD